MDWDKSGVPAAVEMHPSGRVYSVLAEDNVEDGIGGFSIKFAMKFGIKFFKAIRSLHSYRGGDCFGMALAAHKE